MLPNDIRLTFECSEHDCYCTQCKKELYGRNRVPECQSKSPILPGGTEWFCERKRGHLGPHGYWSDHMHATAVWPQEQTHLVGNIEKILFELNSHACNFCGLRASNEDMVGEGAGYACISCAYPTKAPWDYPNEDDEERDQDDDDDDDNVVPAQDDDDDDE